MIKIGVIGLGDIALKAYLPVLSTRNVILHLFTRNSDKLKRISAQYRISTIYNDLNSLIQSGITAAFVHSTTESHEQIVESLLNNGIHVYVDKPVTRELNTTKRLIALAAEKKCVLTVGFNRRYAPAYANLKSVGVPNMIIMQKNRADLPGEIRTFVFDDFIHVIDTLLFLFPFKADKVLVHGQTKNNKLYHLILQLISNNGATAIGIMNRDCGTVEEQLEFFTADGKHVIRNVSETTIHKDRRITTTMTDDWKSMLYNRGFDQIIDAFIYSVENETHTNPADGLATHELCEYILDQINQQRML